MTRHDWFGKVIHREIWKTFKFDHTNKWYMHNPASSLENNTHKLLQDFDIHSDNLISERRLDLIIINKKKRTCKIVDFAMPAEKRIKLKECEKKKISTSTLLDNFKKTMERESNNYTNCDWCFWHGNYRIIKGTGGLGSWQTSGDHPNYYIIVNCKNTEKSPRDLRYLLSLKL